MDAEVDAADADRERERDGRGDDVGPEPAFGERASDQGPEREVDRRAEVAEWPLGKLAESARAPWATRSGRGRSNPALSANVTATPLAMAPTRNMAARGRRSKRKNTAPKSVASVVSSTPSERGEVADGLLGSDGSDRVGRVARGAESQEDLLVEGVRVSLGDHVGELGKGPRPRREDDEGRQKREVLPLAQGSECPPGVMKETG